MVKSENANLIILIIMKELFYLPATKNFSFTPLTKFWDGVIMSTIKAVTKKIGQVSSQRASGWWKLAASRSKDLSLLS